jgi:hypothetical protein
MVKRPFWRSIVAVSWSFIGIRKNSEFQEDLAHITPLHVVGRRFALPVCCL